MAHDVVIKNGTVVDGTGSPAFGADVAIDGDKITAIGKDVGSGKKKSTPREMLSRPASSTRIPTWMPSSCSIRTATRW